MSGHPRRLVLSMLAAAPALLVARRALAGEQQDLVDRAQGVVEDMRSDQNLSRGVDDLIRRARGVFIAPNLIRAAFLFGGEGGTGLMMARGPDGSWGDPAFYVMGSGSFGLQIGVQSSSVLFGVMSERALIKFMNDSVKLGGDLSVAVGPIGAGGQANTTTNLNADVIAYSKAVGLYGGVSIEGSVISVREPWNESYYGAGATARAILIERQFTNGGAAGLRQALTARG